MVNLFKRRGGEPPKELDILEVTRSGGGWLSSSRRRPEEFRYPENFKPWHYRIDLAPLTEAEGVEFAVKFHEELLKLRNLRFDSPDSLEGELKRYVRWRWPGQWLHFLPGKAELHDSSLRLLKRGNDFREELLEAYSNRHLFEFLYASERRLKGEEPQLETHVQRVNVVRVDENGFRGLHRHGLRDFKFERVRGWSEGGGYPSPLAPLPTLEITFSLNPFSVGGNVLETHYGVVGPRGELLYAENHLPSSYWNKSFLHSKA